MNLAVRYTTVHPSAYVQPRALSLPSIDLRPNAMTDSETPHMLLTSEQVMERLLTDAHLRRVASTCVLPAVRCGGEWRFRQSDLEAWITQQRRAPSG